MWMRNWGRSLFASYDPLSWSSLGRHIRAWLSCSAICGTPHTIWRLTFQTSTSNSHSILGNGKRVGNRGVGRICKLGHFAAHFVLSVKIVRPSYKILHSLITVWHTATSISISIPLTLTTNYFISILGSKIAFSSNFEHKLLLGDLLLLGQRIVDLLEDVGWSCGTGLLHLLQNSINLVICPKIASSL